MYWKTCFLYLSRVAGRRKIIILLLFGLILLLFYSLLSRDLNVNANTQFLKKPKPSHLNDTLPVILLWTPYFSGNWITEDGFKTKCLQNRCRLESNRGYLSVASAVVFHWRDVDLNDMPDIRFANQKWILYNMESPENTKHLKHMMEAIQNRINWVMNYRLDSDVITPYGYTKRRIIQLPERVIKHKRRDIAWMVSNCDTPSNREKFAEELSNYVNVDIYGRCGKHSCPKEEYYKCLKMVGENYKFYLSFENSICKDYVTEKLFRIMEFDVIPIVFGGANYTKQLPPNSFIDALSFSSVRQLSNYVQQVSNNYTLFSSFFDWKTKYQVLTSIGYDLCFLCDKLVNTLNADQTKSNFMRDLVKWWYTDSNCVPWVQS